MSRRLLRLCALALPAAMACSGALAQDNSEADEIPPPLPLDDLTVRTIDFEGPRVYVQNNPGVQVYASDTLAFLGTLGAGRNIKMLPPVVDGGPVYVATSYFSRHTRGDRTDVLEYFDPDTLVLMGEIELPPRITVAQSQRPLFRASYDGRFAFLQNATPGTSVTVIDLEAKEVTLEIDTPGCWGIYPALTSVAFSTICSDGSFATYAFNADGTETVRTAGDEVFDVDEDALFIHGELVDGLYVFPSFTGNLYMMDLDGEMPELVGMFSVVEGIEGDWRPGGGQLTAYVPAYGVFYLLMHSDAREGSHKSRSEEVWAIDIAAQEVLSRTEISGLLTITGMEDSLFANNGETRELIRYVLDTRNGFAPVQAAVREAGISRQQLEVR